MYSTVHPDEPMHGFIIQGNVEAQILAIKMLMKRKRTHTVTEQAKEKKSRINNKSWNKDTTIIKMLTYRTSV